MTLVKPAAARRTPSSRNWSSPWLEASIAAWVTPLSARSASRRCRVIGSGVVWVERGRDRALDADGAEVDRGLAERLPDLAGEARDRGLAVGAGDRDHHLGLVAEPAARGDGERPARLVVQDHRHRQRPELGLGGREALGVGQDRRRAHAQRVGDEGRRRAPGCPGSADEEVAGLGLAAVDREPGQLGQRPRPVAGAAGAGQEPERLEARQLVRPFGSGHDRSRRALLGIGLFVSRQRVKQRRARPRARVRGRMPSTGASRRIALPTTGAAVRPAVRKAVSLMTVGRLVERDHQHVLRRRGREERGEGRDRLVARVAAGRRSACRRCRSCRRPRSPGRRRAFAVPRTTTCRSMSRISREVAAEITRSASVGAARRRATMLGRTR